MAFLYRLRIELSAEKGALGRLGGALEHIGGSILTIDLQEVDAHRAVDDLVVEFQSAQSTPAAIIETLANHDAGRLQTWAPVQTAIDPVLRSIRWASAIFGAGQEVDDELRRVIGEICETTNVWLLPAHDDRVRSLIGEHRPVTRVLAEVPPGLEVEFDGAVAFLAVPNDTLTPTAFALVVRPASETFSATEADRVAAMLALHRQARLSDPAAAGSGVWLDVSAS